MIFFDKNKLLRHSKGRADKVLDILRYITCRPIPEKGKLIRLLKYRSINWSGESFLLYPERLLDNAWKYSNRELLQYIFVAARRNYADYKLEGKKTVETYKINTKAIENNRLLSITGDEIHLKYEET